MIVIDEYLAFRVLLAQWPERLPGDELALPTSRHWRLLQALHGGRGGQLSQIPQLPEPDRAAVRNPHPEVLQILDPRPLLDDGAPIAARYGGTGWLIAETLASGVAYGSQLWFGAEHNIGRLVARAAPELGVAVQIAK